MLLPNPKIVIGLNFGDEAKGLVTSYLAKNSPNPIVIRVNAGHNAGHTVVHNGIRHVFSSYGSATMQGVKTIWSEYCTFYPLAFLNEGRALHDLGFTPEVWVHPLCPLTTSFEIEKNKDWESVNKHGSVGVGFGMTHQRQEDHYKLFVKDMQYPKLLEAKLYNIATRYYGWGKVEAKFRIEQTVALCTECLKYITIRENPPLHYASHFTYIFEGAQGILLDMDYGFFPNVTRSNTTSKNAHEYRKNHLSGHTWGEPDVYYITRSYLTRHGNGFLPNEEHKHLLELTNCEKETNTSLSFQGEFRKTILDLDSLNYSLETDNEFSKHCRKNLVVTCVDQTGEEIKATHKGEIITLNVKEIPKYLNTDFHKLYLSYDDTDDLVEVSVANAVII